MNRRLTMATIVAGVTLAATLPATASLNRGTPPNTKIVHKSIGLRKGKASFDFTGSGGVGQLGFECELGNAPYRSCSSPKTYKHLADGKHIFRVRAVDSRGNVDPTPALARFRIKSEAFGAKPGHYRGKTEQHTSVQFFVKDDVVRRTGFKIRSCGSGSWYTTNWGPAAVHPNGRFATKKRSGVVFKGHFEGKHKVSGKIVSSACPRVVSYRARRVRPL